MTEPEVRRQTEEDRLRAQLHAAEARVRELEDAVARCTAQGAQLRRALIHYREGGGGTGTAERSLR